MPTFYALLRTFGLQFSALTIAGLSAAQSVVPSGIELQFGGIGTDGANAISLLSDSGFALAGWKTLDNDRKVTGSWVVRVNHRGGHLWDLEIPNSAPYGVTALSPAFDGGLYVIDGEDSGQSGTTRLSKISPDGMTEWQRTYGLYSGDVISALRPTFDGGLILVGRTRSRSSSQYDGWVLKLDRANNVEWFRILGEAYEDGLEDVTLSTSGGYIVAGWSTQQDDHVIGWAMKLDAKGATEWEQFHDLGIDTEVHRILPAPDGSIVAAATTQTSDERGRRIVLMGLNENGGLMWQQGISSQGNAMATGLARSSLGRYLLSASIEDKDGLAGLAVGFGSGGTLDFIHRHQGSKQMRALAIAPTKNNGYAISGSSTSESTLDQDMWLLISGDVSRRD